MALRVQNVVGVIGSSCSSCFLSVSFVGGAGIEEVRGEEIVSGIVGESV